MLLHCTQLLGTQRMALQIIAHNRNLSKMGPKLCIKKVFLLRIIIFKASRPLSGHHSSNKVENESAAAAQTPRN